MSRFGFAAGAVTLFGVIASGPLALAIVGTFAPQPDWQGAAAFASHYHPLQLLPYALGLALVTGSAMIMVAVHQDAAPEHRPRTLLALVLTAVFASFIFLNYVIQTTFVPAMVRQDRRALDPLIEALTMSNPASLGWALEMWGYGFLGVAMWIAAPALQVGRLTRVVSRTFVANGAVSVVGAVLTAVRSDWVFTTPGMVGYGAWNALMVLLAGVFALAYRAPTPRLVTAPR